MPSATPAPPRRLWLRDEARAAAYFRLELLQPKEGASQAPASSPAPAALVVAPPP